MPTAFLVAFSPVILPLLLAQPAWPSADSRASALTSALPSTGARRLVVQEEAFEIARQMEVRGLSMPPGFYVAFDPDPRFAYGTAACDDDGDYVFVISDALLVAAHYVARGDEETTSLATSLNRIPRAARLPVPASLSKDLGESDTHAYYTTIVRTLLAREMSPLATRHGESIPTPYRCTHPTATHEAADNVWTADEQNAAKAHGDRVHHASAPMSRPELPARFRTLIERCAQTRYLSSFAEWNARLP